jgi:hypothetical protein
MSKPLAVIARGFSYFCGCIKEPCDQLPGKSPPLTRGETGEGDSGRTPSRYSHNLLKMDTRSGCKTYEDLIKRSGSPFLKKGTPRTPLQKLYNLQTLMYPNHGAARETTNVG